MNTAPYWVDIGAHRVGPGEPVFIIGEVAQAHDGSLGTAHAYIDAIANAGCQAVKFQTHIAAAESTASEPFRIRFSSQDARRYDYWKRLEFSAEQWAGLAEHAAERGLVFLSSAFSTEAVDLLASLGMQAWKVGSGETNSAYLIEHMARTGKPVLLSSGMSGWAEIDRAVGLAEGAGAPCCVFQCTSKYPCPPADWGLNAIAEIRARYRGPVGYSDHSGGIAAGMAAVALGADLLEVHVAFSRECFGPDVSASVTTAELRQLVGGVRDIRAASLARVDKDAVSGSMAPLRQIFGKSIVAGRDLAQGAVLALGDFAFKKTGGGLSPNDAGVLVGKRLRRPMAADCVIGADDVE